MANRPKPNTQRLKTPRNDASPTDPRDHCHTNPHTRDKIYNRWAEK